MDAAGAESPTRSTFQFGFLVKFFSKKEHADAFRDGLLYSRKLKHFREDHDDPLRRDKYEGAILLEGGQLSMQVDNQWIPVETVGPLQINYHVLDQLNIFCMTILRSSFARGPSPALLGEIFDQIRDSLPTCMEMGRHAVMVYDPVRFFKQVRNALDRSGYKHSRNQVEYYDTYPPSALPNPFDHGIKWRHAFLKSRKYRKQREYRIAFNTGLPDDPFRLHVGSLRDISSYFKTSDLADPSKWNIRFVAPASAGDRPAIGERAVFDDDGSWAPEGYEFTVVAVEDDEFHICLTSIPETG